MRKRDNNMNANEIKKAWNAFKKEIAKEVNFDLTGCCYMNAKQIANGTATITLCNDWEYDIEIQHYRNSIEKVNGYDSWSEEEKKRNEEHNLTRIAYYEARKAEYGTKMNEAYKKTEAIANSKAYQKLAATIGVNDYGVELKSGVYQLRINY